MGLPISLAPRIRHMKDMAKTACGSPVKNYSFLYDFEITNSTKHIPSRKRQDQRAYLKTITKSILHQMKIIEIRKIELDELLTNKKPASRRVFY